MRGCVAVWLSCIAMLTVSTIAAAQGGDEQRGPIILVAARHLVDPNFARTVVLVMFPREGGPTGVILNRPTDLQLREIFPGREERQGRTDTIYIGGPVQPESLLFLFHNEAGPEHAWPIIDNIYFSGNVDLLDALLEHQRSPDAGQRYFAGYAGWTPGQLQSEIANGDWYVMEAESGIIFDADVATLWWRLYQRATLPRAGNTPHPVPRALALTSG